MKSAAVGVLAGAVLVAGCATGGAAPASTAASVELTVYAAASLARPLQDVVAVYESTHPGTTIVLSIGSSSALRTQIEQGAPADAFLSADTANPQQLVDAGLADGAAAAFAGNGLAVIVPVGDPAGIETPADLARAGVRIVAAGEEVPVTAYAARLIANLSKLGGYPPDFAERYAANVVSREDNAAAVVAKIELGEGDAAIAYVTDARASTNVATVEIPAEAAVTTTYAGVVLAASGREAAAHDLLDWLARPDGQAVLRRFGFLPPP